MTFFRGRYAAYWGAFLIFTGAVLFSTKAIIVKLSYSYGVDAVSLLVLRMIFSLPFYIFILVLINIKKPQKALAGSQWLQMIFLGIVGYYLASYFDFTGLKYITAGLERLILFIYPTLVVIISSVFFKKPFRKKEIFALVLTYGGIVIVVLNDLTFYQNNAVKGSILIFFSALTYAMYLIGTEKLTPVLGTVRFTAWAMIISTVAVVLHYLILESDTKIFDLDQEVYLLSLLMAVFATVIPSFFISEGIRLIGSGSASIIGSVGPVSTIILAYIFLGEVITLYQLAGTILVLTGVWIVSGSDETFEERIKKLKKVIKI